MKKHSAAQKLNLLFSAFLVFAFTVCTYFIEAYTDVITSETVKSIMPLLLFVLFGLFLFYATRVGDGKPVYRFSLAVLLLMVLPGAYIFAASLVQSLPLAEQIGHYGQNMAKIACVSLGYGIPYMFISGFELNDSKDTPLADEPSLEPQEEAAEETEQAIQEESLTPTASEEEVTAENNNEE